MAGLLDIPTESIKSIEIKNTEMTPETLEGKFSRLDLNMTMDDKLVNVEIQINKHEDFRDRTMFYWSKLFTSELGSGENYRDLKTAITINIIDFVMFPDREDYHAEIVPVIKDSGEVYSDKFHIHIFELKKLHKSYRAGNRRELWLNFINSESEEDFDMIRQVNDPVLNKAVRVIIDMSRDTQIRENARIREKALHDEAFYMQGARAEGRAEGEKIGIEKERAEMLSAMKELGISDADIERLIKLREKKGLGE